MINLPGEFADVAEQHRLIKAEKVYAGRVWDIVQDTFDYNGEEVVRDYLQHPGAVAVLALNDNDQVAVIRQYRQPVKSRLVELPAGMLDVAGEPALAAAKRELAEEAELQAETWEPLVEYYSTPGGCSEKLQVFLAHGLSHVDTDFVREEEEADLAVEWVPLAQIRDAIFAGKVHSPSLVVGTLALLAKRSAKA